MKPYTLRYDAITEIYTVHHTSGMRRARYTIGHDPFQWWAARANDDGISVEYIYTGGLSAEGSFKEAVEAAVQALENDPETTSSPPIATEAGKN